jgi:hypothetical protein
MSTVGAVPATAFSTVKPPAVEAVQPVAAPAPAPTTPPAELVSRPAQSLVQLSPAVLESAQPANPRGAVAVVAEVVGPSQRQSSPAPASSPASPARPARAEACYSGGMAEPENLTLQLLREMRDENRQRFNRIDEKLDRVGADLRDLKIRMTNVEEGLAGVNRRIDRIDERLERVERRLELTDETTQP